MCFVVNFFVLFFWLFTQLLEYVVMSFAKFKKLSAIISASTFLSSSFFLLSSFFSFSSFFSSSFPSLPSLSPRTWMLDLLLQPHRTQRFCPFFFQFSPCWSGWIISTVLPLSSAILLSVHSTVLLNLSFEEVFFFQLLCFPVLKFPFVSSLYLLFPCWNFLRFYFFQTYLLLLVEVFYNCFSVFVRESQLPHHLSAGVYWLCSYIQSETSWFLVWQVVFFTEIWNYEYYIWDWILFEPLS